MLLNLFNQYTNLCPTITKMFFYIYNFICYACICILIDWFFWAYSVIASEWYKLNRWDWSCILMSFAILVYKYRIST